MMGEIRRKDWNLRRHGNEEIDTSKELPKRIPDSGMTQNLKLMSVV
jgi:hypothetical protein